MFLRVLLTICVAVLPLSAAVAGRNDPRTTCTPEPGPFRYIMHSGAGNDRIEGGDGSVLAFGEKDRDFVEGGSDDDEIHGGLDADLLVGSGGADRFVYDEFGDSLTGEDGTWSPDTGDTIVDFYSVDGDKIDLGNLLVSQSDGPSKFGWGNRTPGSWLVWTANNSSDTFVMADANGDGLADVAIRLIGKVSLSPSDFCGVDAP